VEERGHGEIWKNAAITLLSVALGAALAAIPLLSSTSHWDRWVVPTYCTTVCVAFLLSIVCGVAGRSVRRERADSVADIKADLDQLLDAYAYREDDPAEQAEVPASAPKPALLQRMRSEARENIRLIELARESGQYWRITDPSPEMKEWKRHHSFLESQPQYAAAYEIGRRAARDVESMMGVRSLRIFTGRRTVKANDNLEPALVSLREFDEVLSTAMQDATPTALPSA
jgi:hypothetical protein